MTNHAALNAEEHADILRQCEADGLDMTACRAMTFRELRDMWSDYQSDMLAAIEMLKSAG